jgi:hypothetical protein
MSLRAGSSRDPRRTREDEGGRGRTREDEGGRGRTFTWLQPHAVFPDLNDAGDYPVQFFAIRHIALSVPLLHALVEQNRAVLSALYHVFLIIAVLDVATIATQGYALPFIGPLPALANALLGSAVFVIPMTLAVRALRSDR